MLRRQDDVVLKRRVFPNRSALAGGRGLPAEKKSAGNHVHGVHESHVPDCPLKYTIVDHKDRLPDALELGVEPLP